MLSMNSVDGSNYESSDAGIYDYEEEEEEEEDGEGVEDEPNLVIEEGESIEGNDYGEDAFDANDPDLDPAEFENDEDFARALQDVR
ncbi:major centromere autoantigen B-like [Zingiber officinale]|nr:major centromere autoantigen B-like [Zingiber officinale]